MASTTILRVALTTRLRQAGACAAIALAIGCGTNPAGPSGSDNLSKTGAVISGTVTTAQAGLSLTGLTAKIVGTNLSAAVGDSGLFQIANVPAGTVRVSFKNDAINATANVPGVTLDQFVQLQVQLTPTGAVVLDDERQLKVSLCHTEGTGDFHLIDISADAEATHRAHGDGMIGDPVPGQPGKTFDASCHVVGPSIDIEKLTNGDDADEAPGPRIGVGSSVTWQYVVTNTGTLNLTGIAVTDDKGVVVNCNSQTTLAAGATMTCTGTGVVTAIGPYRNVGSVTANWTSSSGSGSVTDADPSNYLGITPIEIQKLTNGDDANNAPGPSIVVGNAVIWEYRLTNVGTVPLTAIAVVDDRGVVVTCGQTTIAPAATLTCTGSGVAVLGQYANIGTVTAHWVNGALSGNVTASDPSHYLGITADEEGAKVTLCHKTGAGFYVKITVSVDAEPAHRAHGDAMPGEAVPNLPGKSFTASCGVQ